MAACGTCGEILGEGGLCPSCPRPSMPDLELAIPAREKPKPKPRAVKKEEQELELAFDVRKSHDPSSSLSGIGLSPGFAPDPARISNPNVAVASAPTSMRTRLASSPRASHPDDGPPDPLARARLLANYGEPPKSFFLSPLYTHRVYRRRGELRRALAGRREDAARAKEAVLNAMVELGSRARAQARTVAVTKDLVTAIERSEAVLRSQHEAASKEESSHTERLRGVETRLRECEEALLVSRAEEERALAAHTALLEEKARAEAQKKRAEVMLRNRAAGAPAPPGTEEGRLRAEQDLLRLSGLLTRSDFDLSSAKSRTADALVRVETVRSERASLVGWHERQSGARSQEATARNAETRQLMAHLASHVLGDEKTFGDAYSGARQTIRTLELSVRAREEEVLLHEAAIECYDPMTYQRGYVAVGLLGTLVAILLVIPIVLRATMVIEPPKPASVMTP